MDSQQTTTPSLGEPVDVYRSVRNRPTNKVCLCHRNSSYVIRKDAPEHGLFLTGSCPEHTNYAELEAKGFILPTVHPELPKRFVDTDVTRLHPSMQKAVLWNPVAGKAGLLMHGTSGIGKTRAAWHIVNRYWCDGLKQGYNLPVRFMSMRAFEKALIDSFEERRHGKVLEEICREPFLVLDDLGKERLTSRMATDLFAVVDHRTERDLPTIVTTNFSGKAFLERFLPHDKETGLATARRFRDYYEIVGMAQPASQ